MRAPARNLKELMKQAKELNTKLIQLSDNGQNLVEKLKEKAKESGLSFEDNDPALTQLKSSEEKIKKTKEALNKKEQDFNEKYNNKLDPMLRPGEPTPEQALDLDANELEHLSDYGEYLDNQAQALREEFNNLNNDLPPDLKPEGEALQKDSEELADQTNTLRNDLRPDPNQPPKPSPELQKDQIAEQRKKVGLEPDKPRPEPTGPELDKNPDGTPKQDPNNMRGPDRESHLSDADIRQEHIRNQQQGGIRNEQFEREDSGRREKYHELAGQQGGVVGHGHVNKVVNENDLGGSRQEGSHFSMFNRERKGDSLETLANKTESPENVDQTTPEQTTKSKKDNAMYNPYAGQDKLKRDDEQ